MKMNKNYWLLLLAFAGFLTVSCNNVEKVAEEDTTRKRWSSEEANNWYKQQEWLVGANFVPSTAINQLEMWQAQTFDTATIRKELEWAAAIGMNTMRVYLHDLVFKQDKEAFLDRIDQFLAIAASLGIKPLLVIFDSVWDPSPVAGTQPQPKPGLHNSGWVQSPGKDILLDSTQHASLETYVKTVINRFSKDERIIGWDLWNEPENMNNDFYRPKEPLNKIEIVEKLLKDCFEWARSQNPVQPLTAGLWAGNWSNDSTLKSIERLMLEESDIISFHNYSNTAEFEKNVRELQRYNRPIWCTEYMARGNNSTFEGVLPIAKEHNIAMFNWGLVDGKSQTKYPWNSWEKAYEGEPPVWFHDVFRADGTPYNEKETNLIKTLTNRK